MVAISGNVQMVLMIIGGVLFFILIIHYGGNYLWDLIEHRWPLRTVCQSLADLREHLQQHYKRGLRRCLMHLDTAMKDLNLILYKFYIIDDQHIFYFIIFRDITPSHPLYDEFCSLIEDKGYTPETGITIRRSRCQKQKSDKIIRNYEKDFDNNLTCEIEGVDDTMALIRAAMEEFGESPAKEPLFSIRVTQGMEIADEFVHGSQPLLKGWGPGKPARPYQRWHQGLKRGLWYWGLVYLKELIFGRKQQEDPFAPVATSTATEKTSDDGDAESHENASNEN